MESKSPSRDINIKLTRDRLQVARAPVPDLLRQYDSRSGDQLAEAPPCCPKENGCFAIPYRCRSCVLGCTLFQGFGQTSTKVPYPTRYIPIDGWLAAVVD
jgi:hypothetical protein